MGIFGTAFQGMMDQGTSATRNSIGSLGTGLDQLTVNDQWSTITNGPAPRPIVDISISYNLEDDAHHLTLSTDYSVEHSGGRVQMVKMQITGVSKNLSWAAHADTVQKHFVRGDPGPKALLDAVNAAKSAGFEFKETEVKNLEVIVMSQQLG